MRSTAPTSIAVLADDLTGAADCAVAFGRSGLEASVEIDGDVALGPGVRAYSSDTRDRDEAEAIDRVALLTQAIVRAGFEHLYKKIDSLLRGHVAAELEVMLSVLDAPVAIITPAFPSHGRAVLGGRLTSPTHAVDLIELLTRRFGDAVGHVGLEELGAGRLADRIALAPRGGVLVCDAANEADLVRVVDGAEKSERPLLYVGSAGLAAPLGARWGRANSEPPADAVVHRVLERVAVVVGSATELAHRQVAYLVGKRPDVDWIEVSPGDLISSGSEGTIAVLDGFVSALHRGATPVLSIAPPRKGQVADGRELAEGLGGLLAGAGELDGLVITGGETARAVLGRLSVSGFQVLGEVEPGVVRARAEGGVELELVVKSGGFGDEATLVRCVEALRP